MGFAEFSGMEMWNQLKSPAVVTQVFFEGILSWDRRIAIGDRKRFTVLWSGTPLFPKKLSAYSDKFTQKLIQASNCPA